MPLFRSTMFAGLLLACAGCDNPFASSSVILWVDNVVVPDTPSRNAAFTVTLTVVTGGCRSFERIHGERSTGHLVLTAIGRHSGGQVCPTDIRYEERNYPVSPPFEDPFTITVRQPDGSGMIRPIQFE